MGRFHIYIIYYWVNIMSQQDVEHKTTN